MGSRVMHYCISSLLAKELHIDDPQFILGSIAPDVHKHMNAPKAVSHFIRKNSDGKLFVDYWAFKEKYKKHMDEPFYSGYFYHLISDVVWVDGIYDKKIKHLPQPDKKEAQLAYYRDFWRLNGKLIDYYSLRFEPLEAMTVHIDEIDWLCLPKLVEDLKADFDRKDEAKEEVLEILNFDEVIYILESTVRECAAISLKA